MAEEDPKPFGKPIRMRRLTRQLASSTRLLWQRAILRSSVRTAMLRTSTRFAFCLAVAYLRTRYRALLVRKLASANLRLQLLLDGVKGHALFVVDTTGLITSWNRGAERLFGYKTREVLGKHFSMLFTPEDVQDRVPDELLRQADRCERSNDHGWQIGKDNTRFFAEGSLVALGKGARREFGRQVHDITRRRNAEEALRQAQKLDTIGRLAGGVAHDFNNLLTVILGYSEMVLEQLPSDDPSRQSIQIVVDAGVRGAALTRQLLTFSRQTVLEPAVLNLNDAISELERILQRLIGEDILLSTILDPAIDSVKVDPNLLGQVVMNLVVNARDAMPTGGNLTIETANVSWEQDYAASHPQMATGEYVMLATSDTGCGMTSEARARIFEPFFTTKEPGKGTGLGLAVVDGIVRQSNGHIEVYSEPDIGTTIKIYFPAVEDQVTATKAAVSVRSMRGVETILLVEDEREVRELASHVFQSHGYEVLVANDGTEAMLIAKKFLGLIDLLVTDVVMPRMGGPELANTLQSLYPKIKVLYTSGYTDSTVIRHGLLQEQVSFLQKPYTPHSLTSKVRAVLDTANVSTASGQ